MDYNLTRSALYLSCLDLFMPTHADTLYPDVTARQRADKEVSQIEGSFVGIRVHKLVAAVLVCISRFESSYFLLH